jgi:hypothetical protein
MNPQKEIKISTSKIEGESFGRSTGSDVEYRGLSPLSSCFSPHKHSVDDKHDAEDQDEGEASPQLELHRERGLMSAPAEPSLSTYATA